MPERMAPGSKLGGIRFHAGRTQLGDGASGGLGHARVPPDSRGNSHDGGLLSVQVDGR